MAAEFGVGGQDGIVAVETDGLDAKDVGLDAVAQAAADGVAQFREARLGLLAVFGHGLGAADVLKFDRQPQAVDPFVRQAVEVLVGVIVDVVHQLVAVLGARLIGPKKQREMRVRMTGVRVSAPSGRKGPRADWILSSR